MRPVEARHITIRACGPRFTRPSCFTLIELIIVICILAILGSVGVGVYSGTAVNQQIEGAAKRIESDLALARQNAVTKSTSQSVLFTPGTGTYVLNGMADPDRPGKTYIVNLSVPPHEAKIISADLGGDAEIIFDGHGKPDSGGTIVIEAGNRQMTLTVDPDTGLVARS